MKRYIKVGSLLAVTFAAQAGNVTSQTFFTVKPHFQSASPERVALARDPQFNFYNNGIGGGLSLTVYGSKMTGEGKNKLARFFLPQACNGCCLNVQEYDQAVEDIIPQGNLGSADYSSTKDVEARNFNIVTASGTSGSNDGSFSSRVCFKPSQNVTGLGFLYKQRLTEKCDGNTGFWLEIGLPVERVQNRFILRETINDNGNGPDFNNKGLDGATHVGSMIEAFRQPNWKYGKIDCRCQNAKWGAADLEVKFGYNYVITDCAFLQSYLGFVAPTGTRVSGRFVFEPIVGNNRHWGLLFGTTAGYDLYEKCGWNIAWYLDMASRYLFDNNQIRSFDLVGKPWSRYIETYSSIAQAQDAFNGNRSQFSGTSGINVFTKCVKVKPHYQVDVNTAFDFQKEFECVTTQAEIGFHVYARQAESIDLDCCKAVNNIAIKDIQGTGFTTTARTIKANYKDSYVAIGGVTNPGYLALNPCDINLESAAHPAVVNYSLYGAFGLKSNRECALLGSIGASYEFQNREINSALERWTVWAKFAFGF